MVYNDKTLKNKIKQKLFEYENPKRIALSRRFPFLKRPILFVRKSMRHLDNFLDSQIKYRRSKTFFSCVVARHQSVLRRKLGDSNPQLQEQKITNLQKAVERLNGVIIQPGDVFSLWNLIGEPTYEKGYVNGMLLSSGSVIEGVGGGLCQLSNFLYWIFLHAPIKTIERYHHSMDVFPDSGRTLPFGSGATILYNFIDLKVQNISSSPLQLKIWLTDKHLKGQILSETRIPEKAHIYQENHCFIKKEGKYFRYNEIYKETKIKGKVIKREHIATNFAPVLYTIDAEYFEKNNYTVIEL